MEKAQIIKALGELRKNQKARKFKQSVDLIINLKNFDIKKESVNLFIALPHKIKEKKIAAFLNKKMPGIDTITKPEFDAYKDKKKAKALAKGYGFFIAHASLMPAVAATFGKFLGPSGKMPAPQLGIVTEETEAKIKEMIKKINNTARVKSKEPSLKFCVAKEDMKDDEIVENMLVAYNAVLNALPRNKENISSVKIKFTMSKPIKIE
jgi:large subunit ribosomal protein L1